jgi:SAM-dependent methyltransferase
MGYYDNVNLDLLNRIPLGVERILELGCGSGALGAAYKRRNPGCEWIGVELIETAAKQAKGVLDTVFIGDIEDDDFDWHLIRADYDAIVFGDVLEHLRDPWRVLKKLVGFLKATGYVVSCIPNVGHIQVISQLLKGDFEYAASGLLDRTHLRFFTLKTMRHLYKGAGLEVYKYLPRRTPLGASEQHLIELLGLATDYLNEGASDPHSLQALQYVLAGSNQCALPRLHIAFWAMAPRFAEVRTVLPLQAIGTMVNVTYSFHDKVLKLPQIPAGVEKIVIVQRALPDSDAQWMLSVEQLHRNGWAVVAEWDDHPSLFAPEVLKNFEKAPWAIVRHADGVQTSTGLLRDEILAVRPDKPSDSVTIFENNLFELPQMREQGLGPLRIFVGALNREADAALILPAINAALKMYDDVYVTVLHDRQLFDAIETPHKDFYAVQPYSGYLDLMSRCDVMLAPLSDTVGNRCKSDLKYVEASGFGLATIASPTVYGATIVDGKTGLIAHDADEFTTKLLAILANRVELKSLGQAARDYVSCFRLQTYLVARKLAFYQKVYRSTFS